MTTNNNFPLVKATILGGFLSGIVKFGWEVPFPPRTPLRNETNPPQALLELFGFPKELSHFTYSFSETDLPIFSFLVHFGFSFFFAWLYFKLSEKNSKITLWHGAMYGIVIYVLFHVILMPLMKIVPPPQKQSLAEHASEFFGHIVWAWSIEVIRVYVNKTKKAITS